MQMSVGWLRGISPAKVCSHGAWVYGSATLSYVMCRKEPDAFLHNVYERAYYFMLFATYYAESRLG